MLADIVPACVRGGNAFPFCAMKQERETPSTQPNLILTGFMGTGKSSVGRLLARRLKRPFVDTDKEIEKRAQRKIKDIFAEEGEACVEEWLPEAGAVVATGGGILTSPGMSEALRSRGVVVTLFASPETIFARTRGGSRPLLETEDPLAKIRALLAARERDYLNAGIGVLTDGRTMPELAAGILRIYRRACRARRA